MLPRVYVTIRLLSLIGDVRNLRWYDGRMKMEKAIAITLGGSLIASLLCLLAIMIKFTVELLAQ